MTYLLLDPSDLLARGVPFEEAAYSTGAAKHGQRCTFEQVVDEAQVVMQRHDAPLDLIATPDELIDTHTQLPRPGAMDWSSVRPDQFDAIPFLRELQMALTAAKHSSK